MLRNPITFSRATDKAESRAQVVPHDVKETSPLTSAVSSAPINAAESALIERARQDPEAFGILYEQYIDRVYAYIYHRVGNAQDTEDLTARTFYRALDKLHTYEDRGLPFSAWLFRIAHNLVANWHRDHGRRRFLSLDKIWSQSKEGDTPEEKVEQEERHAALWDAINHLPDDRRNLLLYKFSSRLSNVEIGEMMQKSESAIKSLYFRTLASLRAELEAKGWGGQSAGDEADDAADESQETPSELQDKERR
ncbi:MAG: sigma-70 family RNA polymerase sigma factor [Caldilineaceae bacterium]